MINRDDLLHEPVDEDRQAHSQEAHVGAHSAGSGGTGQPADPDHARDLVAELAVLTAPDEQVYRDDRRGRCAWVDCPVASPNRFCPKHRRWRLARNQIKVRTALLVRIMAIELERQGYPVSTS